MENMLSRDSTHIESRNLDTDLARSAGNARPDSFVDNESFLRPPPIGDRYDPDPSSPDSCHSRPGTSASATSSVSSARTKGTSPISGRVRDSSSSPRVLQRDKRKRLSWFGGSKEVKNESQEDFTNSPPAWIAGHDEQPPYDLENLLNGQPVSELWMPEGDCFVYVFPQESGKGPSFKIRSSIFASSRTLRTLSLGSPTDQDSDRSPESPNREIHLYLPDEKSGHQSAETETLVANRNLFSFLMGKSLVATKGKRSLFDIFMDISKLLHHYEFANVDGSTYGKVATSSFDSYIDELGLADVRASPGTTIEGLVLGERMKSVKLYHEAFTHAAGQHEAILKLESPTFKLVSALSANRLNRAAMELEKHADDVQRILQDLDFPAIFSGTMASRTSEDRKDVDFDKWKESFFATRKFFLKYYKHHYKSWPPRASSKHSGGLNRLVLQGIYRDLCALYDLLVDRTALSTRIRDADSSEDTPDTDPRSKTIRQIFSEYDRSSPPVKPPVPLDVPVIPSLKTTQPEFDTGNVVKDARAMSKHLKDEEIGKILKASHGAELFGTDFTEAFKAFERKSAHSHNIVDIVHHRVGAWIFVYALLQVLPVLVIDAPELKHVETVEYFLCQPPKFGVPWAKEDALHGASIHENTSGAVATLPADLIEPGIEGLYRRSHCWTIAELWQAENPAALSALQRRTANPLSSRLAAGRRGSGSDNERHGDADSPSHSKTSTIHIKVSSSALKDPAKTFDAILANAADDAGMGKRKK